MGLFCVPTSDEMEDQLKALMANINLYLELTPEVKGDYRYLLECFALGIGKSMLGELAVERVAYEIAFLNIDDDTFDGDIAVDEPTVVGTVNVECSIIVKGGEVDVFGCEVHFDQVASPLARTQFIMREYFSQHEATDELIEAISTALTQELNK